MKLNSYNLAIFFVALMAILSGCKKFLEHEPDLRTQLDSKDKVAQLLTSAYPKADYLSFTETSSDNAEDKGPSSSYFSLGNSEPCLTKNYMFEDFTSGTDIVSGSSDLYWADTYKAIASANLALNYINQHPEQSGLLPYKGEALVARAYAHFMLVSLYAKIYEPGGANSSPGIPYVVEVEKVVQGSYERGTVAGVYEKIENDLVAGLPLIDGSVYKVPKYHFTSEAANAFAARFYLFKGDFDKAIAYANRVLTNDAQTKGMLRPWNTTYINATDNAFQKMFTQSNQNANLLIVEAPSVWSRILGFRFGMGNNARNNILESQNISGGRCDYRGNPYIYPYLTTNKFKELFFETKIGSGFGDPYIMIPLLTADELLMNRAESYVRKAQPDFTLALQDINVFLSTRIRNYNASTHSVTLDKVKAYYNTQDEKQGLINTILDLKRAEFMQEGLRWFDILRHGLTVKHSIVDGNNKLVKTLELGKNDLRRVFQLPQPALKAGLALNPR